MPFLDWLTKSFPAVALVGILAVLPAAEAKHHKHHDEFNNNQVPEHITDEVYHNLELYSHWAAAAYCPSNLNYEHFAKPLYCDTVIAPCNLVSDTNTTAIYEFRDKGPYKISGNVAADFDREVMVLAFHGNTKGQDQEYKANDWSVQRYHGDDLVTWPSLKECDGCKASKYFADAWGTMSIQIPYILGLGLRRFPNLVITGHGRGGGMATAAAMWARQRGINTTLYTYGAPRIGNEAFANYISNQGQNYRVTHKLAEGSRKPGVKHGYRHMEPEYYINPDGYPTIDDITKLSGLENQNGNAGDEHVQNELNRWFFGQINRCDIEGIKDLGGEETRFGKVEDQHAAEEEKTPDARWQNNPHAVYPPGGSPSSVPSSAPSRTKKGPVRQTQEPEHDQGEVESSESSSAGGVPPRQKQGLKQSQEQEYEQEQKQKLEGEYDQVEIESGYAAAQASRASLPPPG